MRLLRLVALVWLGSAGTARAATVMAATCTSADVQAAVNVAAGGDQVIVPNGTCTWTTGVTISGKGIIVQGESMAGVVITNNAPYGIVITVDSVRHVEVARMTVNGSGVFIRVLPHGSPDDGKAVLVHHLTLNDT